MPQQDKVFCRKEILSRLRGLSPEEKLKDSQRTAEWLLKWPALADFQTVLGFHALPSEPNLAAFYEVWSQKRRKLGFPHVENELMGYRLGNGPAAQGLDLGLDLRLEGRLLILVPALAFGPGGERLGRGGGCFDRFLSQLRQAPPPAGFLTLGVAFPGFTKQSFPVDPWDQPVQGLVTAEGFEELPFPSASGIFKTGAAF